MKRDFSGWGVILFGVLLTCGGVYAMASGWEYVQLERGWSQFIAGSVALSGGVVTVAIGRLIRVLTANERFAPLERRAHTAPTRSSESRTEAENNRAPVATRKPTTTIVQRSGSIERSLEPAQVPPEPALAPVPHEIDRYTAGDSTYVMMSDGSVEVHLPTEVRRYPTIAALRADAEIRRD
jgi:hypothetical protein